MKRIGIMGGTFDPIHNGHLMLGRQAYQEYHLDEIWYMPSKQPPHKKKIDLTPVNDRCNMVKLAVADDPAAFFSDFELLRAGTSYTAMTVTLLKDQYPKNRFFFIIGADSLFELETWYHPEIILRSVYLLVADRLYQHSISTIEEKIQYFRDKYHAEIDFLHCGRMDISSSELRRMIIQGKSISAYVPPAVEEYIRKYQLYHEDFLYE